MQNRPLGRSGIFVPPLALGGNVFGWTIDEQTSFSVLDAFLDHGFSLIDTADVYSKWAPGNQGGESETIVGNWLKSRKVRDRVVIATKVGNEMGPDRKGLAGKYILSAVEDSLKRLGIETIDLYQSHVDDLSTPVEETLAAYDTLIKTGKVRAIGASNFTAARLAEALDASEKLGLPRYDTLQPLYNLYNRPEFEDELLAVCESREVACIPYYALASGFLTGKYRSEADLTKSKRGPGNAKYLTPRGFRILDALDAVSAVLDSLPGRVAIAWLMAQPTIAAPIASATSVAQVEELAEAASLVLDDDSMEILNEASKSES